MSISTTRIPRTQARALAVELVELLRPACDRLEIVGSIRRHTPLVGDIELLVIPHFEARDDLFGPRDDLVWDCLSERVGALVEAHTLAPRSLPSRGPVLGPRFKALTYKGVAVDLFACAPPANYALLKLIRTGSAGFSRRFVTQRSKGGWLPNALRCEGGQLWHGDHVVDASEERDVFSAAGLVWLPPPDRTPSVRARFRPDGSFRDWFDRGPKPS